MRVITVSEVSSWMGKFAPLDLAEPWDNVGLLWGDPTDRVERVMTCLTVTPETAGEAVSSGVNLIVSHHPVLFRPTQKVVVGVGEGRLLWSLARAGVAIYSPHTAFDNAAQGINQGLAERFDLREIRPLREAPARPRFKVVTFVPPGDRDPVLSASFAAGAGQIGDYSECSFTTAGRGTFFGSEATHPTVGQGGRREQVREWKVEIVCPGDRLEGVLEAIRRAHSYEEPAIDVIPLRDEPSGPGVGRIGRLVEAQSLESFATMVSRELGSSTIQYAGEPTRRVETVAIACGAGDDFLKDAHRAGADVLLTGEARFHRGLEARSLGIGLVVAGHHATERPGVEALALRLAEAFPSLSVWASRVEADPFLSVSS